MRVNRTEWIRYGIFIPALVILECFWLEDILRASGNVWLYVILYSFTVAYLLTPLVRLVSSKTGALDYPGERNVHTHPTPLLGGVAIYVSFTITLLANHILSTQVKAVLVAGTLVFFLGVGDDVWGIPAWIKFLVQISIAVIPPLWGIYIDIFPNTLIWHVAEVALTVMWIVGITNAFNFIDGMDGLATGIAAISCFFFGIIAMRTGQQLFLLITMALLGSSLGFLPYNFRHLKSAMLFLGDTGSTFIGFMLACIAVMGEWAEGDPVKALSVPLLIMGVLILDMVYTTVSRLVLGKVGSFTEWLEYTGRDHLHHRLNSLGLSKNESVLFIYSFTAILGTGAVVIGRSSTTEVFLELFQALAIFSLVAILMLRSRRED
ncbi:MAG: glycosyltransferase family 4 protein [Candidatus Glassbacteria bacterium]